MAWLGQNAALEIHVPQWRFGPRGAFADPDRLVFDLDPGEGVELAETAAIAVIVRDRLTEDGLQTVPVTSGSKGIHLYAHIENMTSDQASAYAHEIAQELEAKYPDRVLSRMTRALRTEKIFLDWSQNNANKTTIAPYSLRGRDHPMVAAPRFWDELDDPHLRQLDYREVLSRISDSSDPMKGLEEGKILRRRRLPAAVKKREIGPPPDEQSADRTDKLARYRSMRSKDKTPEPVPEAGDNLPKGNDDTFVIQEHHASRLHWDFRLERGGVLVSWALPKGIPTDARTNHLAVHVEDHPVDYAGFAGTIPKGEYGGGWVVIWDSGHYTAEKWRDDEVIVEMRGQKATGRFALIRTRDNQWLIHRTKGQPDLPPVQPLTEPPEDLTEVWHSNRAEQDGQPAEKQPAETAKPATRKSRRDDMPDNIPPMLATLATVGAMSSDKTWRLEGKWDGIRAVAYVGNGPLRLVSRTGKPFVGYPELEELNDLLDGHQAILDGEIVALDGHGRSSFGLLQQRMGLTRPADVERARAEVGIRYFVFDVLFLDGVSLLGKTYDDRRRVLEALGLEGEFVRVPDQLSGPAEAALARSKELDWEGILAKTSDSVYEPGGRGRTWLKIKNQRAQEVVIVGWKPGAGRRSGGIGSLLLAVPSAEKDGAFTYIGKVGTGFTDAMLEDLATKLQPLARQTPPLAAEIPRADAKDAHWVRPQFVGEVTFSEWTRDNLVRQASWRGLRPDKRPGDVRKES